MHEDACREFMQTLNGVGSVFGDSHYVSRSGQAGSEASDNQLGGDCPENSFRFSLAFQKTWGNIYFQSRSATPTRAESMRARNIAPAHWPGLGTETKRL